ncbi:hypothetical protein Misp01_18030 [Microtetraspora sp. NBRC 13810]|nr:hypothetical protein Misp01_18030 [Microtetraspora sp. NBRC 13810]
MRTPLKGLSYRDSINESPPVFPNLLVFAQGDRNRVSNTGNGIAGRSDRAAAVAAGSGP